LASLDFRLSEGVRLASSRRLLPPPPEEDPPDGGGAADDDDGDAAADDDEQPDDNDDDLRPNERALGRMAAEPAAALASGARFSTLGLPVAPPPPPPPVGAAAAAAAAPGFASAKDDCRCMKGLLLPLPRLPPGLEGSRCLGIKSSTAAGIALSPSDVTANVDGDADTDAEAQR
jgi:hypothetical protein